MKLNLIAESAFGGFVRSAKTFLVLTWLTLSISACAADKQTSAIDAIFAALKSKTAPGAAVLVIKDGHRVFEQGYGITDLSSRRLIDGQTNFRLASLTKQFTAMSIMLLVHDGTLHYEDRLTDIFPDFPAYGNAITIQHLLNHTSGLIDYEDLMPVLGPSTSAGGIPQIQDSEVLQLLKAQKTTKFVPGTKWDYSNSGYVVLGTIVAKVSGKSFGDFLHQRIFAPLKMEHSLAYERGKNEVANRAFGHSHVSGKWALTDQSPTSATLGDGGVYTSLGDMFLWDKALSDHVLLSEADMRPGFTPVKVSGAGPTEPDGSPAAYGFGWFLNPYKGHSRMWHYGETMGFRTTIQRFVDDNLTIVILSNRSDLNPSKLALKVADLYLGKKN